MKKQPEEAANSESEEDVGTDIDMTDSEDDMPEQVFENTKNPWMKSSRFYFLLIGCSFISAMAIRVEIRVSHCW